MTVTNIAFAAGRFTAPDTIRFERFLPGTIERVWSYLVDSEKRGKWLATGEIAPVSGSCFGLHFMHADLSPRKVPAPPAFRQYDAGHISHHEVITADAPRRLHRTV